MLRRFAEQMEVTLILYRWHLVAIRNSSKASVGSRMRRVTMHNSDEMERDWREWVSVQHRSSGARAGEPAQVPGTS